VEDNETFVSRLEAVNEERLRTERVELMAFAIDGYNAAQVMELVQKRVIRFEPDRVVYMMCLNDFDFEDASAQKVKYFRKPKSFFWLLIEDLRKQARGYYDYHFEKNADKVFDSIAKTHRMLVERGSELEVVILPIFPPQGFDHYPLSHIHEKVIARLHQNGIRVLDLLNSPLAKDPAPSPYTLEATDPWHLNKQGHELLASLLLEVTF
jgi:lysophospholipase L1-like esterase